MARHLTAARVRRLLAAAGLVAVVFSLHLGLADLLARHAARFAQAQALPPRIEVAYVRELALAPPVRRSAAVSAQPRRVSVPAAAAASAPSPAAVAAAEPAYEAAPAEVAAQPEATASAVAVVPPPADMAASAVAEGAPPFEWPVSTRMRYVLSGHYRGEVHGHAQVEWIRVGARYQVHLDVNVGLLASRRMSSDGDITAEGLMPRRYDQETRLPFNEPQRTAVHFDHDRVLLANGRTLPRWPGLQDTVSQFVQLSWMFDTQPQRLRVGHSVEIPLAMPRNVSVWAYDVVEEETLYTPFGEVQAFHLKPRREPRAGGDMTVDIWIAPQLRHLPVRFRIRPDAEAYFDLMLDRRPELAAPDPTLPRRPS